MQRSIERFNIVSKATSDAIWDYDVASGRVEWNRAIQTLFGYNKLVFTRQWWEERVHPEDIDNVMSEISGAIAQRLTRLKHEYRFRCANNSYKNVLDRSFLVYDEAGELLRIIGSMEDVTERMGYLQTLEAQNLRLKEIGWTQSHVVRAPLANIMGIAELLSMGIDDQTTQQELITRLAKSATDLDLIIKDIINKTKTFNEYSQG
jgi:PAS domain S-box-containing protein